MFDQGRYFLVSGGDSSWQISNRRSSSAEEFELAKIGESPKEHQDSPSTHQKAPLRGSRRSEFNFFLAEQMGPDCGFAVRLL